MEDQYVTVVSPNDVLFGRGSGPNDHEGNIKFRDLVSQRKSEYMATNHRQTKAKIAKAIVDTVFANNGRFLKKLENAELLKLGFQTGMDVYAVVDDDTVMEKAKQALRQNRDKNSSGNYASVAKNAKTAANAMNSMPPPKPPVAPTSYAHQLEFPEPLPLNTGVSNVPPVPAFSGGPIPTSNQQSFYTDADGYATYTTTLDDPEDQTLFNNRPPSGNRRGSLLGGRKDGSRRDSIPLGEVWRRDSMMGMKGESMQMSELMESFKAMSTQGELNSSADTIGTIDNLGGTGQMSGISNMSMVSMASGISLFKSNSNDHDSGRSSESPDIAYSGSGGPERAGTSDMVMSSFREHDDGGNGIGLPPKQTAANAGGNRRESLIPADMWNSKNVNALLQAPIEGSSTNMGISSTTMGILADHSTSAVSPRTLGQLEGQPDSLNYLGSSSMSVLRAAGGDQSSSNTQSVFDINRSSGRILPPEQRK